MSKEVLTQHQNALAIAGILKRGDLSEMYQGLNELTEGTDASPLLATTLLRYQAVIDASERPHHFNGGDQYDVLFTHLSTLHDTEILPCSTTRVVGDYQVISISASESLSEKFFNQIIGPLQWIGNQAENRRMLYEVVRAGLSESPNNESVMFIDALERAHARYFYHLPKKRKIFIIEWPTPEVLKAYPEQLQKAFTFLTEAPGYVKAHKSGLFFLSKSELGHDISQYYEQEAQKLANILAEAGHNFPTSYILDIFLFENAVHENLGHNAATALLGSIIDPTQKEAGSHVCEAIATSLTRDLRRYVATTQLDQLSAEQILLLPQEKGSDSYTSYRYYYLPILLNALYALLEKRLANLHDDSYQDFCDEYQVNALYFFNLSTFTTIPHVSSSKGHYFFVARALEFFANARIEQLALHDEDLDDYISSMQTKKNGSRYPKLPEDMLIKDLVYELLDTLDVSIDALNRALDAEWELRLTISSVQPSSDEARGPIVSAYSSIQNKVEWTYSQLEMC